MDVIDLDTLNTFAKAAVLVNSLNTNLIGSLEHVESRLRRVNPDAAERARLGFTAAMNCYNAARHELTVVREHSSYGHMAVVLNLAQDACRRSLWYTNLALEFIIGNREDHLEFRRSLQSALDESGR